jgi:hypothetical protein
MLFPPELDVNARRSGTNAAPLAKLPPFTGGSFMNRDIAGLLSEAWLRSELDYPPEFKRPFLQKRLAGP